MLTVHLLLQGGDLLEETLFDGLVRLGFVPVVEDLLLSLVVGAFKVEVGGDQGVGKDFDLLELVGEHRGTGRVNDVEVPDPAEVAEDLLDDLGYCLSVPCLPLVALIEFPRADIIGEYLGRGLESLKA